MVLLTNATSIYFEVNHLTFIGPLLPDVAGSKIEIDECNLLGSSRTRVEAHNKS